MVTCKMEVREVPPHVFWCRRDDGKAEGGYRPSTNERILSICARTYVSKTYNQMSARPSVHQESFLAS